MLDENLPVFFLTESTDGVKHHETFLLRRGGSDPEPAYSLRHADPAQQTSKNCYAVALFDAWNAEVLYGEVMIRPKWTQPSLNAEEIRRHGGVAPPPEPIMPTGFTVQLYNPELQIDITRETGMLGSTHYDFSMPQDTFRMPSGSMLDRTQNDPGTSQTTPRINFSMKREGKLSKDMVLYVKGKSTDIMHKKKSKEPDIAIAIFKGLKEVTILESNLYRVEMEDAKGLEVVTLLISAVIRDVFHGQMSQAFNVSSAAPRRTSGGKLSPTGGRPAAAAVAGGAGMYTMSGGLAGGPPSSQAPRPNGGPITDPRTQWEIDQETQRLKRVQEDEARLERKNAEMRRRERERADEEEARRIQRMLEQEEQEQQRRQAEIDKETQRLQKIYGNQQQLPPPSSTRPQTHSAPISQSPFPHAPHAPNSNLNTYPQFPQQQQQQPRPPQPPATPYQQYNPMGYNQTHPQQPTLPPRPTSQVYPAHPSSSSSGLNALNAGASLGSWFSGRDKNKQKSNANLRRGSDPSNPLQKKTSSVF